MNRSESITKLAPAIVAMQSELRGYSEDSENDFYHSKYGDLSSVWAAIREPLTKHDLAVVQTLEVCDDPLDVVVVTTLLHSSGEWITGRGKMRAAKEGPQAIGSAITYARRYGLAAIVGIAPADDDGEGATNRDSSSRTSRQQTAGRRADAESRPAATSDTRTPERRRFDAMVANHPDIQPARLKVLAGLCVVWNGGKNDMVALDALAALIDGAEDGMDDTALDQALRFADAGQVDQVGRMVADWRAAPKPEGEES